MLSIRKIVDSYFSKRTFPHWCVLLLDSAILFLSGVFVYWCFNRGTALQLNFWPLTYLMLLCVGVHFIFFAIFRTYSGIIRYSSFNDLIRVALAMGCSALAVIAVHFFTNSCPSRVFAHVQVRHILIAEAIATGLMWLLRVSIKWVYDTYFRTEGAKNVFIYGIRAGGIGLAKAIRSEKPMRYCLRGFISHDPALGANGTRLMGEPVYEVDASLPDVIRRNGIAAVLVAPGRIGKFRNDTALQDYILQSGARIFSANNVVDTEHDAIKGAPTLKEVSIEDLLPRDEICVDLESVAESLRGKRILITGSAGSIGSEIVRQVASFAPSKMMLIDSAETPQHDIRRMMARDFPSVPCATVVTSITKADRMENIFKTFLPEYVFHAAAYKHVPMMEDNPCESIQNNVLGTKILADLSVKYGVRRFVMVSTDKAVNPTNVMGCSKRICEVYVQSLNKAERDGVVKGQTQFITTRFGNVLGSNGSVIPIFERQIKAGGPVTVTDPDIIRYFMLIPEACDLVLEAGTKGEGGEIFVFDMGKPVRIADLARRMIELSGAKGVEIKYTGLRDGEKLYEEVLSESEATKPSFHEKIRIACVREYDWSDVSREIDALIAQSHTYDDMAVVASMKRLVPEYISNHSKYTVLDHKA
ncbi:MAG: nucleoside-diphosphate sugar epimerase/dehydratase [Bacteroidales bacterium]|nr:nucleoside-diphosphate sugar epimerase/dehydratase [Bacteroidales bacterium]